MERSAKLGREESKFEFYKMIKVVQEVDAGYHTRPTALSPEEAARFIETKIGDMADEVFGVLLLDTKNKPTGWGIVAHGAINQINIQPRSVLVPALISGASAIIIFHNHPSGDPEPSKEDEKLTHALIEAANLIGVRILDHIIIGGGAGVFKSLKEVRMM